MLIHFLQPPHSTTKSEDNSVYTYLVNKNECPISLRHPLTAIINIIALIYHYDYNMGLRLPEHEGFTLVST